jgi:hypothetical protein
MSKAERIVSPYAEIDSELKLVVFDSCYDAGLRDAELAREVHRQLGLLCAHPLADLAFRAMQEQQPALIPLDEQPQAPQGPMLGLLERGE